MEKRVADLEGLVQRRLDYLVPLEEEPGVASSKILPAPHTVSLVGCGYKGGQPKSGVEKGPACLRQHGICKEIEWRGWRLNDLGDIAVDFDKWNETNDPPTSTGLKNLRQVGEACGKLHDTVSPHHGKSLVLTMGGDHSLAIGSISAALKQWGEKLRIIWVDAHGDINTDKTSPSGNIHGMPVAFLCGMMVGELPGFEWFKPCLKPSQIVYVGLRHVDYHEKKIIQETGIRAYSLREVDKYGIGKVMEMALEYLGPEKDYPIHLSFDIDAMDPFFCPSTGTRVGGGLTYREASYVCEAVAETGNLVSIDLVELNPDIGTEQDVAQSAEVTLSILRSCLGHELMNVQL